MNSIAYIAAVICAVSIASSVIYVILPKSNTKRVMNTIIGVFLLCSLIVPIKNAVLNFDLKIDLPKLEKGVTASADEAYGKALYKKAESILESSVESYLLSKGYKIKGANVKLNKDNPEGLYIERISIYINKSDIPEADNIISLTENKFEKTPELMVT